MKKKILKLSLKIFFILFVISSAILWHMYDLTYKSEISKIRSREINDLNDRNAIVVRIMDSLTSDVLFLSRLPDLKTYREPEHIAELFLEFSLAKKVYDQVRFIDSSGKEQIRINWDNGSPKIVERDGLQSKKGRYYFDDTFKLDKEQIFISPLDLNIEHGKVEEALKSMLRIGTPFYDAYNNKKGIVLLNYCGKDLIDELRKNIKSKYSELYFLNQDGYWLYSDKKENEWGIHVF